ncbi:hypothetical protein GSD1FS_0870 [Bifidobacterium sp. GSD1FS]|uniref:Uncharacterized protein n=1 Tax=Bifidobacterium canis TaxID=2610880 RepID=A0A7K1J4S2_9BIFI|nr:hypothetical protein [Bifidobacterium canis]
MCINSKSRCNNSKTLHLCRYYRWIRRFDTQNSHIISNNSKTICQNSKTTCFCRFYRWIRRFDLDRKLKMRINSKCICNNSKATCNNSKLAEIQAYKRHA